ncbi:MAG: ester cyclase [Myxococcota bacterium]
MSGELSVLDGDYRATWRLESGHGLARLVVGTEELASIEFSSVERPEGTWWSPLAAQAMRLASALSPPLRIHGTSAGSTIVRTYIEEFKNRQRFSVFPRVFAPDFRHRFDHRDSPGDMTTWVKTGQDFLRGFPDVKVEITHLLAHDDWVVECNRASGTHRGEFRGHSPTGRPVQWDEMHFYRLKRGKIVENRPAVSFSSIVAQLET